MLLFYYNDKIALNLEKGYTVKVAFLLALSIFTRNAANICAAFSEKSHCF